MAIEKIVNLNVNDNLNQTEENVKSLKTQLREANMEVVKMSEKFGAASKEAIEAAKRAAELKDKIDDARESVQLFDPGKKFQAFTTGAQQLAAGFSAVQGAMALAGSESEDLQKQMLKVQGAIALTQGLSELKDLGKSYQQLKIVAVNSLNAIKGAIGATGIGLLVIALGTVVAYWDDIKKAVTDALPFLKNTESAFNKIKEVAAGVGNAIKNYILSPFKAIGKLLTGDFSGAVDEIKKGFNVVASYSEGAAKQRQEQLEEANKKRLEAIIAQKEKEIEVEKARGNDTYAQELANIKRKQQLAKDDAEQLEKLRQEERVLIASHGKKLADAQAARNKEAQQKQKEHDAELKRQREQEQKDLLEFQRKINLAQGQMLDDSKKQQADTLDQFLSDQEKASQKSFDVFSKNLSDNLSSTSLTLEQKKYLITRAEQEITDNVILSEEDRTKAEKQLSEARRQITQLEAQAKMQALDQYGSFLMAASQMAGEQTEGGKGLAVAATLISTYSSAMKAYESQLTIPTPDAPVRAYIAAGIAAATGLMNVQKILSVQVPGGGGGKGAGAAGAGAAAPPRFNIVGQNSNNQLAQTIAGKQQQPVKAYVVSGEVSTSQALDRNRVKTATFGG